MVNKVQKGYVTGMKHFSFLKARTLQVQILFVLLVNMKKLHLTSHNGSHLSSHQNISCK